MEKGSKKSSSLIKNVDTLIRSIQTTSECLSFDSKRIKPCVEALQNVNAAELPNAVMAAKDLVNRLTVADEKLAEALCLISDALSLVSIGSKNFKDAVK